MALLDASGRPACLIGGLVVLRWGQPRDTTDADFSEVTEDPDLLRPFEAAVWQARSR
jgi:hypothetical protein